MLFATLLCARGATPQVSRVAATLEGTVRDSSGAAIAGSSVSVRNTFTSQSRTITSDEQRFFRAEQLAVGPYKVRVEQPGFALYQHTGVVLSLGQTIHLDIVLSPASASETYGQCATLCNGYISSLRSIVGGSGEDRGATRKEPQLSRFRTSGADLFRTIGHSPRNSRSTSACDTISSAYLQASIRTRITQAREWVWLGVHRPSGFCDRVTGFSLIAMCSRT